MCDRQGPSLFEGRFTLYPIEVRFINAKLNIKYTVHTFAIEPHLKQITKCNLQ